MSQIYYNNFWFYYFLLQELNPRNATLDYIYYVEWRQFTVDYNNSTPENSEEIKQFNENTPSPGKMQMQMTHSRALLGDFDHVIKEIQDYHDKINNSRRKSKKCVRFESDDKLNTCIPDVDNELDINEVEINRINTNKSKKSKKQRQQLQLDGLKEKVNSSQEESIEFLSTPKKHGRFYNFITKSGIREKIEKFFMRKSRGMADDQKVKKMERSNSYCRHDDADNVILIDDLEFEEIDAYGYSTVYSGVEESSC